MLEFTTEPGKMDVFNIGPWPLDPDETVTRADGVEVPQSELWDMDLANALTNCIIAAGPDRDVVLVHGVAARKDAKRIDAPDDRCMTIKPEKVSGVQQITLPAPARESALQLVRDALSEAEERLAAYRALGAQKAASVQEKCELVAQLRSDEAHGTLDSFLSIEDEDGED